MEKVIITSTGKDNIGVLGSVCVMLKMYNINILDVRQTIVDGYFNLIMIADMQRCQDRFDVVKNDIEELGRKIGIVITIQKAEIFETMHRI